MRKSFGDVEVLRGIDLEVRPGEVFALLGPNGAGKTTAVRILATLLRPDAGVARVCGFDVTADPREVQRSISLTGQSAAVDELLTGEENLVLLGRLRRLGRRGARQRAAELLEQFDLAGAGRRRVRTYSGGMRRRLDLAVSLVVAPRVLFLDEPTTGLDPRSRQTTWAAVRELSAAGVTVFLTTQYLEEADQLADRIAFLDHGDIIAMGRPADLKAQLAGERVELRIDAPEAAGRALELAGAGAVAARGGLMVPTGGTAREVRELLNRLDAAGVDVGQVAVHRPTLDDVFLSMTKG
ncbi:ATP-binding cassette domain-containing protein [Actinoplanes sp. NBRC 103695]|uniref:ATP-binding cassette domain-containing protein n=1 Tax=Actinoplanes sp. NBRC 103695 TaxID=3032202 RepID=UPI0024A25A86|nr:daunorubicin resistance protein DrrA family ABC transporter ATP-binding protein [Actinoplanes sp. NBRC 103695]